MWVVCLTMSQIRYAQEHALPFLTTIGKQGDKAALHVLQDEIQSWLWTLDQVEVSSDGTFATIGGGAKVEQVVDGLRVVN